MSYKLLPNIAGVRVAPGNGEESGFSLDSAETELKFVSDGSIFLGTDSETKTVFMATGQIGGPTVSTMVLPYTHTAFALGNDFNTVRRTTLPELLIPPNSVILGISAIVSQPLGTESGELQGNSNIWFEFSGEPYQSPYPFVAMLTGAAHTSGPNDVPYPNMQGGWYEKLGCASYFVGGLWGGATENFPTIAVRGVSNNYGSGDDGGGGDYVNMDFTDWTTLGEAGFTNDPDTPWTQSTTQFVSPPASAMSMTDQSYTSSRLTWQGEVNNYATLTFNFKIDDPDQYGSYALLEVYTNGMYLGSYYGGQDWQEVRLDRSIPPGSLTEIQFVFTNANGLGEACYLDDIKLQEAGDGYGREESLTQGACEISVWYEENAQANRSVRRDLTDEEIKEIEARKAVLANEMYAEGIPGEVIAAELERMSLEDLRRIEEARLNGATLAMNTEKIINDAGSADIAGAIAEVTDE